MKVRVRSRRPTQGDAASVGVRDLKASLSSYLRRVRSGAALTVTDRGRPVARIIPAGIPAGLERLVRTGQLSWSGRKPALPSRSLKLRGAGPSVAEMVGQDRRDRDDAIFDAVWPKPKRRRRR
ncbi:MAG: type II toxin-antitoxin system Phd/YefM family antitoxin [Candidatus Limnocylindria bacterium]